MEREAILQTAARRAAALVAGDADALRAFHHPDLVWTTFRGDVLDREAYVRGNTDGSLVWIEQRLEDPHVVVAAGDTAVLTAVVVDEVERGGVRETFRLRLTQTWVRDGDAWLVLAAHASPYDCGMAPAEQEILERADAWQRALEARDAEAAAAFLADDYALVVSHPEVVVMPRAEWLRLLPDYVISGYEIHHRSVEVRGGVASVVQRVEMEAAVAGADRSGPFVIVDLWVEDGGAWRVWRRHSTPLSTGPMPRG